MNEIAKVRQEIRSRGYMSAVQIILQLAKQKPNISRDEINLILRSLKCKDIYKVQYTNSYVETLKLKDLYIYNPTPKRRPVKKKVVAKAK